MRYSVALPHPTRGASFGDPDALAGIASAIEAAGFDACAVMDHPFPLLEHPRAGGQALDIFALAGYLTCATDRLTVHLNIVVMGYRNPFLVARAVGTLDHLSRGRVLVGIGAGYMRAEFDALGAEFARRAELVDEGVIAMKRAWSGEAVHLESSAWVARGNSMFPPPYTRPHPRLLRGGNSKRAIESAVRHFDGWNPFEAPVDVARQARTAALRGLDDLETRIGYLREIQERLGRTGAFEISLDRPDPGWLDAGRTSIEDELGRLEDAGVTRLVTYLPGASVEEVLENVHRLADAVSSSQKP